jgi:hypothetical protein
VPRFSALLEQKAFSAGASCAWYQVCHSMRGGSVRFRWLAHVESVAGFVHPKLSGSFRTPLLNFVPSTGEPTLRRAFRGPLFHVVSSSTHLGALAGAAAAHGLDRGAAMGNAVGPGGRGGRRRVRRALELEEGELSLTRREKGMDRSHAHSESPWP